MAKVKLYDPDKKNSSFMQFGYLTSIKKRRIDKRTKEYENQKKHKVNIVKYKKND